MDTETGSMEVAGMVETVRCQSNKALAMKEVFEEVFGDGWEPPQASIDVLSTLSWDL